MTNEPQDRPPQYRVPTKLYYIAGGVIAMWIFVTFFLRNPYTQATEGDYYDRHPYDEFTTWALVLVVIPMIGLAAFLAWTRRGRG
ncbi:MAG TPA: hypothetical protein VK446_16510 [Methylocystis sp.]|nr:hypothetical protein [Methylocystis sp.]